MVWEYILLEIKSLSTVKLRGKGWSSKVQYAAEQGRQCQLQKIRSERALLVPRKIFYSSQELLSILRGAFSPQLGKTVIGRRNPLTKEINAFFSTSNLDLISSKMSKGQILKTVRSKTVVVLGAKEFFVMADEESLHGESMDSWNEGT